jgi:hypothetical protein
MTDTAAVNTTSFFFRFQYGQGRLGHLSDVAQLVIRQSLSLVVMVHYCLEQSLQFKHVHYHYATMEPGSYSNYPVYYIGDVLRDAEIPKVPDRQQLKRQIETHTRDILLNRRQLV